MLDEGGRATGVLSNGDDIDGVAGDRRSGCSVSGTELSLIFMKATGEMSSLYAGRGIRNSLVGSYPAVRMVREATSHGTLTIAVAAE
jgi:hypothetical protein